MSISAADIRVSEVPKRGTIRPGTEATLLLNCFATHLDIPALPENRADYMRRKVIGRVYGDIAQDFERFVALVCGGEPTGEAAALCEKIREKLRGDGHGEQPHRSFTPDAVVTPQQ